MASYNFIAAEPTIQVLSPDVVRDAQRVTGQAAVSNVVYSLLFAPYPTDPTGKVVWDDQAIASQMELWAGYWDTNSAVPGVAGVSVTQEVDASGQLVDVALVTVLSTSGNSSTLLQLYPHDFFPDTFAPRVEAARAQLDAVEATGS